jgi:CheY-like chemotaxis protein
MRKIGMTVLIVEDTTGQALLIQKIISMGGKHQVIVAKDAFEAYALIKVLSDVDVVILDNKLPYVNGIEFLQKIKSHVIYKNIPVVMSTADDDFASFITVGASYCLHKPYRKQQILDILDKIEGHSATE